jgi:hypothetical protein
MTFAVQRHFRIAKTLCSNPAYLDKAIGAAYVSRHNAQFEHK